VCHSFSLPAFGIANTVHRMVLQVTNCCASWGSLRRYTAYHSHHYVACRARRANVAFDGSSDLKGVLDAAGFQSGLDASPGAASTCASGATVNPSDGPIEPRSRTRRRASLRPSF
jgi:hypothetical protein